MNTAPQSTSLLFRNRTGAATHLAATCLLLLPRRRKRFRRKPLDIIPVGWSSSSTGVASRGWSSWETTKGGTFGGPSISVETPRHRRESSHSTAPAASFHSTAPAASFHSTTPAANYDAAIDPVMIKAAGIAEQRALSHSTLKMLAFL